MRARASFEIGDPDTPSRCRALGGHPQPRTFSCQTASAGERRTRISARASGGPSKVDAGELAGAACGKGEVEGGRGGKLASGLESAAPQCRSAGLDPEKQCGSAGMGRLGNRLEMNEGLGFAGKPGVGRMARLAEDIGTATAWVVVEARYRKLKVGAESSAGCRPRGLVKSHPNSPPNSDGRCLARPAARRGRSAGISGCDPREGG